MGGALARRRLEKNCALGRQRTQAGGGASGRAQCGIRVQKRGGSGLYRVRGKVGGRQTREIGHSLARPPAGLPSPRDLHTMEHPQTPFTPTPPTYSAAISDSGVHPVFTARNCLVFPFILIC